MRRINTLCGVVDIQNIFFSEVSIGISFNSILFLFHILQFILERRLQITDLIISLLALIHFCMLTVMGFTAVHIFASQNVWNDIKCKFLAHLHRFLRGLSLSATCLLSVLQAITLSPRSFCLAKFKKKSPQHSLCSLLVPWVFYMSCGAHFSFSVVDDYNFSSHGLIFVTESCIILPMSYITRHLFSVLKIFWDVSFIGLMSLTSVYMVALLCRYKKQAWHQHSTSLSPKASPEQRATQTILVLMSLFMLMYCMDCIISASRLLQNSDPICHSIQMMISNSYATLSPLLLMVTKKRISRFLKSLVGRTVDA
ncbi:LOW QUALITY PROTEIN: vomeronasal type-1 receptor 90-like [Mastomys coucha]|uniref:LOW QUALITY PROTEIN: vomeronasal type-1 receptor 90-like n=1 Tax=Mastomys coucha TaxID=35658 RepID=UPI001261FECF|nr:LOW QUALITY PROTEIN: vomeronasal type-1 receptor 90-like [Mastomys coucha]